jgi:secreted PhoX family phosphatase
VDGTNTEALFNFPRGVAVDGAGNLYVADSGNNTVRMLTSSRMVLTIGGAAGVSGGTDGIGSTANFAEPSGVAVDGSGRIYVADTGNNRITAGTPMPIVNMAGSAGGLRVSWPASFAGFVLQQNSNLGNPSGWSAASNSISDDGTNKSILFSSPTGDLLFRLKAN